MATAGSGIHFEGNLTANLKAFPVHVNRSILAAAEYVAPLAEGHMKTNAPWTDQTGAARNGLHAKVQSTPVTIGIVLYHSVPYGVFLEVRWDGRYAIIVPTIQEFGPIFLATIAKLTFQGKAP